MITRDQYKGPLTKAAEAMFARAERLARHRDLAHQVRKRSVRARPVSPIRTVLQALGLTAASLRHWEEAGIVEFERRKGQRLIDEAALERLQMVVQLRREGFSVREIAWLAEVLPPDVEAMQAALAGRRSANAAVSAQGRLSRQPGR